MLRNITLNHITKIEGHAKLDLAIDNGKVTTCHLSATEGARYFEGLVKNRKFYEAHEMTSRICGICSCGHVVAAVQAIEDALGFQPSAQTFRLRELLTLGERIRSHATHLYFLALPDYLGYESALAMAPTYKAELMKALGLMKIGNAIVKLLGARDLHPVSATPGGWLHLPSTGELRAVAKELEKAKKDAIATCSLFASLTHPDFDSPSEWFSLKHESEYAMLRGDFHSPRVVFECHKLHDFVREYHEDYSTANFVVVKGGRQYMLGALPRLNNNASQLSKDAKAMVKKVRLRLPSSNPYHQNLAQAIELIHAIDHAHDICSAL
ncbi:TPA: hypothetical protein HA270_03730, partial [Candidatus Woesearchaeota archaeon]|nr:hypothetical protein [Candidatus Woesearchaeota archaeon]